MSTFAQLKSNVSLVLGLDQTASSDEDVLLGRRLNEAVRDILLRTRCYITDGTITLTAGTSDYRPDATVLKITEAYVTSSSTAGRLQIDTPQNILRLRRGAGSSGGVTRWAWQGGMFMVYPTPALADVITIYYVPKPTEMSSGAHDPSNSTYGGIPVEFHKAIEYYALWQGAEYDNSQAWEFGEKALQRYEAELVKIRRYMNSRPGRSSRVAIPGHMPNGYALRPDQIGV